MRASSRRRIELARADKMGGQGSDHLVAMPADSSLPNIPLLRNWHAFKRVLEENAVYRLLIFLPVGTAAGVLEWNPTAVFIFNLLAIVPLSVLLSAVTEQLSGNFNSSVGALLNATFGNALELIVSLPTVLCFLHEWLT